MHKYILLLFLYIKSAFKLLPRVLITMLTIVILIAGIGVFGTKVLDMDKGEPERYSIALVLPENSDSYTKLAFDFLSGIDTVKNVCEFIQMDYEAAQNGINDGSVYAMIIVPDDFVTHIIDGTNIPAQIVLPKSGFNSKSEFFRALVNAGASDLSAAQAGIYAADDLCVSYNIPLGVSKSEDYLNKVYFTFALNRAVMFDTENVTATGELSIVQFFVCSGIVLLLLLCGISVQELLKSENAGMNAMLRRNRINSLVLDFAKAFGVTSVFFILVMLSFVAVKIVGIRITVLNAIIGKVTFAGVCSIFVTIFSIITLVQLIYRITNSDIAGVLLVFVLSIIMVFASGGFIPGSMLPDAVQQIGQILPSNGYLMNCREIITGNVGIRFVVINAVYGIVFLGISSLISWRKCR